jgi:hypothetical protein
LNKSCAWKYEHKIISDDHNKPIIQRGLRTRDRMVVGFTTTCEICHHWICEFESRSWRSIPNTSLCDKVCQWLVTGRWFSLVTQVSSTNKTDLQEVDNFLWVINITLVSESYVLLFIVISMHIYQWNMFKLKLMDYGV